MSGVSKFSTGPLAVHKLPNTVKDLMKRVRRGQVKSIVLVVVRTDGTFWTGAAAADGEKLDFVHMLGTLRFLEEDLIRQAYNEPSPLEEP